MTAVADVRADSTATIWYPSQTPNYRVARSRRRIGIPDANITMHIPFAGGAFGRHLFGESAIEAALVSQALGRPIKLLWTRNDDMRHGRFRPMTHHALRATWVAGVMLLAGITASPLRKWTSGMAMATRWRRAASTWRTRKSNRLAFNGTVSVPYEFGVTSQMIASPRFEVPTGSWRSIYSGFTNCANEIFVDEIALARGEDEVAVPPRSPRESTSRHAPRDQVPPAGAAKRATGVGRCRRARAWRRRPPRVPVRRRVSRRDRRHQPGQTRAWSARSPRSTWASRSTRRASRPRCRAC